MASIEVWTFQATCPPGTPITAPITVPLVMPTRIVNRITILVPPGPAGLMGFAFGSAGQQSIPSAKGTFIVSDHEVIPYDLDGQIESGAWQVFMYNTGKFAHTIYIRFEVSLPEITPASQTVQPLDDATINAQAPASPVTSQSTPPAPGAVTGSPGAVPVAPTLTPLPTL